MTTFASFADFEKPDHLISFCKKLSDSTSRERDYDCNGDIWLPLPEDSQSENQNTENQNTENQNTENQNTENQNTENLVETE